MPVLFWSLLRETTPFYFLRPNWKRFALQVCQNEMGHLPALSSRQGRNPAFSALRAPLAFQAACDGLQQATFGLAASSVKQ